MKIIISTVAAVILLSPFANAEIINQSGLNLNSVKMTGELRPRFETNDDGSTKDMGVALTNRFKLKMIYSPEYVEGLNVGGAFVNVSNFGLGNYNFYESANDKPEYATILEPKNTRLTEAFLDYTNFKTNIVVGRQVLKLDNGRYLWDSNWRQTYKSHDALKIVNKSIKNLVLTGIFSNRQHGVIPGNFINLTDVSPHAKNINNKSVWLNAKYNILGKKNLSITGFHYMIEDLHDTTGFYLSGKSKIENIGLKYRVEYSQQLDSTLGDGKSVEPFYGSINLDAKYKSSSVSIGYSIQEAGFTTPYAGYHKFNGFSDEKFGLSNIKTLQAVGKTKCLFYDRAMWRVGLYDFTRESDGVNMGKEIDITFKAKINKSLVVSLQTSIYKEGETLSGTSDTIKTWAQVQFKF